MPWKLTTQRESEAHSGIEVGARYGTERKDDGNQGRAGRKRIR